MPCPGAIRYQHADMIRLPIQLRLQAYGLGLRVEAFDGKLPLNAILKP